MNRSLLVALVFAAAFWMASPVVYGQNDVLSLVSPGVLGGGESVSSVESPYADILNPAASGGTQRTTLDLNYIALPGIGDETAWGNVLNAGITLPSPAGVFTASAHLLSSSFPNLDLGTLGALNLSFAKDLYRNLYVGAGLGFQLGQD